MNKARGRQISLFENERMNLNGAIELSLASLREYGERYRHWSIAFSGGKDSSATVTFVAWAIKENLIPRPESLSILYADTRKEYPPLHQTAMLVLEALRRDGFDARVVLPDLDDRFFVYMLGYGVPPPSNTFRWCTPKLKVQPMMNALQGVGGKAGEKVLSITGVRMGESAARDQRIAVSCSKDTGECGQGWFQVSTNEAVADTLAPLLHWRLCHIYDWLYFENHRHGYDEVAGIADVYGDGDVRTGCSGCNLASRDVALERLCRTEKWAHLSPLLELRPLYAELKKPRNRKRKAVPERTKAGSYSKNGQRMGPLLMKAREYGLEKVLDIQKRARVDLINDEEEARIREMWALNLWPQKWSADDIAADVPIDLIKTVGDELVVQPLLLRALERKVG